MTLVLLAKERAIAKGDGPSSYAPIVQAMQNMSDAEKTRLRHKFDIAYVCGGYRKNSVLEVFSAL